MHQGKIYAKSKFQVPSPDWLGLLVVSYPVPPTKKLSVQEGAGHKTSLLVGSQSFIEGSVYFSGNRTHSICYSY